MKRSLTGIYAIKKKLFAPAKATIQRTSIPKNFMHAQQFIGRVELKVMVAFVFRALNKQLLLIQPGFMKCFCMYFHVHIYIEGGHWF